MIEAQQTDVETVSNNTKTALVLASIAAVFFFGIILKYWIFG